MENQENSKSENQGTPKVESQALEANSSSTYATLIVNCPHCQTLNRLDLGDLDDITIPEIEACRCWKCAKKFWLPGQKQTKEWNSRWDDIEEPITHQELGLRVGEDLIETAFCEDGSP